MCDLYTGWEAAVCESSTTQCDKLYCLASPNMRKAYAGGHIGVHGSRGAAKAANYSSLRCVCLGCDGQ